MRNCGLNVRGGRYAQWGLGFRRRCDERRAAKLWLVDTSAHRFHRSAIRRQVALLFGSRVNLAISSHSAACLRNSSGGCIGSLRSLVPRPPPLSLTIQRCNREGQGIAHMPKAVGSPRAPPGVSRGRGCNISRAAEPTAQLRQWNGARRACPSRWRP